MILQFFGYESSSYFKIASSDRLYHKQFGSKILYATIELIEVNLICHEKTKENFNLAGRRILDLHPNCKISSPYFTLKQKYINSKILISIKANIEVHIPLSRPIWDKYGAIISN